MNSFILSSVVTQVLVVVVLVVKGPEGHYEGGRHDPDEDRGAHYLPSGSGLDEGTPQDEEVSVDEDAYCQQPVAEVDKESVSALKLFPFYISNKLTNGLYRESAGYPYFVSNSCNRVALIDAQSGVKDYHPV